jgi:radical SAM protein with 4Fe4S-binding SPASM domain
MTRINPFTEIYRRCNDPAGRGDPDKLPRFPRYIDIELTNSCNFRCLMCPTGTGISRRKKGFMSDDIFFKILDEAGMNKTPLRFIGWGEPLLHPKLLQYLELCKKNQLITHLNTNGYLLTEPIMQKFIDIPLDSLKFSFQGIDRKSYREMRNTDFFDELLVKIEKLHQLRGDSDKPYIHVSTTLTYESQEEAEAFRQNISRFVDLVTVGKTSLDYIDADKARLGPVDKQRLRDLMLQESITKEHPSCGEVFNVLSVNWNGLVSACCADYDDKMTVGDLRRESLAGIWRTRKMDAYRRLLTEMKHDSLEICRNCYDPMGIQRKATRQGN